MKAVETQARAGFKNILYVTDFSPAAEFAFETAKVFARKYNARLIAAHVVEPTEYRFVPQLGNVETTVGLEEYARKNLCRLEEKILGIPHVLAIEHGEVWPAISELARKNDADLLVMGTHGRTGLRRLLMGSVAERVFRRAHCPVLTIGPGAERKPAEDIQCIVFATDFEAESKAAFAYALVIAQESEAEVTMLHVERAPLEPLDSPAVLESEAEKAMTAMIPEEVRSWFRPRMLIRFGDPAAQILKVARERNADLIVLGARPLEPHPAMATHVIMATAHKVVCDAECPVLTVRG